MFYSGDLQSGIALALQQSKSVACFITDEDVKSKEWEDSFLPDDSVATVLRRKAVTLRILADSQSAGFLKAYYPVHDVPSMIIIQ